MVIYMFKSTTAGNTFWLYHDALSADPHGLGCRITTPVVLLYYKLSFHHVTQRPASFPR